jgi:hypothetical protein
MVSIASALCCAMVGCPVEVTLRKARASPLGDSPPGKAPLPVPKLEAIMQNLSAQYLQSVSFNAHFPDEASWESRMMEFGLHREAFSISRSEGGSGAVIKFWEPDRLEALRIMAKLGDFRAA